MDACVPEAIGAIRRLNAFERLPDKDVDILARFMTCPDPERLCRACGKLLTGRQSQWCSEECRDRARRQTAEGMFPSHRVR